MGKINNATQKDVLTGVEEIPVNDAGNDRKITVTGILSFLFGKSNKAALADADKFAINGTNTTTWANIKSFFVSEAPTTEGLPYIQVGGDWFDSAQYAIHSITGNAQVVNIDMRDQKQLVIRLSGGVTSLAAFTKNVFTGRYFSKVVVVDNQTAAAIPATNLSADYYESGLSSTHSFPVGVTRIYYKYMDGKLFAGLGNVVSGGGGGLASIAEESNYEIRAITEYEGGNDVFNYTTGSLYEYVSAETEADDNDNFLEPNNSTGSGRWVKRQDFVRKSDVALRIVNIEEGSNITLDADSGNTYFRYKGASPITVSVPNTIPLALPFAINQMGVGEITLQGAAGVVLTTANLKTGGQGFGVTILKIANNLVDVIGGVE